MKKIILFFCFFTFPLFAYAQENCEIGKNPFEKYTCRVETACSDFKENKVVINTSAENRKFQKSQSSSFEDADTELKNAIQLYKTNMNDIYKCGIINTQRNSFTIIKNKLTSNASIKSTLFPKIDSMKQKLDLIANGETLKCQNIDNSSLLKQTILKQTTYETCKYNFYLLYLQEQYNNVGNVLQLPNPSSAENSENAIKISEENEKILSLYSTGRTNTEVINQINSINNKIQQEIERTYKVFPIAFQAYSEYESYFVVHILLDSVKESFISLRKNLHKVLNPINQVVYKISNAMSK